MSVTKDKPAPYATSSAILDLIDRHRNRGLPAPVTFDILARAGISDSLIPRTLQALQTLDLIDDQGMPTETLEGLRLAPESEFQNRLTEWIQDAYADVLAFVNPSEDDETAVRDAFRSYSPVGQQPRMVTLFMGLLAAAGMADEKHRGHSRRARATPSPPSKPSGGAKTKTPDQSSRRSIQMPPPSLPPEISEKALEYRLVDLMSEAASDPDTMHAIIKVITFLKTKNVSDPALREDDAGGGEE